MKKREKWQLILAALYAEAIHCGNFAEVNSGTMEMEPGEFSWTLYMMQMRGLIEGCIFQPPRPDSPGNLMGVLRDNLLLTPQGFQMAEAALGRGTDTGRLHAVWDMLRDAGCSVMAEIIYGWIR